MKIHHSRRWGVVLALLSTPLVASQESCSSTAECQETQYCNSLGICMDMGDCAEVKDCLDETNVFGQALCIGVEFCEDGSCGIACGAEPSITDPTPVDPNFLCTTSADCPSEKYYCSTGGTCEKPGGCNVVDDCFLDDNQGYPVAPCMGGMECMDRKCEMNCYGGSDALFACETASDCPDSSMYCNSYETCQQSGTCVIAEDCDLPGNSYMSIDCVGFNFCDEMGRCGKQCAEESEPVEAGEGELGEVPRPTPFSCTVSEECPDEEYCAGTGSCMPMGACDQLDDCSNLGNLFITPACVGTLTCEEGRCGKQCGGLPDLGEDNEAPVVIDGIPCSNDDDCNGITTSTTRSAVEEPMYCAQGTCKKHGECSSDNDCINPANFMWSDPRCFGYLFCTSEGTCDRKCGNDCKNGGRAVQCFANPCETMDWSECDDAVSCVMDACNGECDQMLFNAAGYKLADCAVAADGDAIDISGMEGTKAGADLDRVNEPKEPSAEGVNPEDTKPVTEPEQDGNQNLDTSNLVSSANRTTQLFAILAAVFVATIL